MYRFYLSAKAILPFSRSHFYPYRINPEYLGIFTKSFSLHCLCFYVCISLSTYLFFFCFFLHPYQLFRCHFPTLFWFFQRLSISDKFQMFFQIQNWHSWSNLEYVMMLFKSLQSTVEKEEPIPLTGYWITNIFLTGSALWLQRPYFSTYYLLDP